MAVNRREFLKIAGLSTLVGLGGKTAFELLAPGELEAREAPPLGRGQKWGMVVNMHKFDDALMDKCIEACHRFHNVPNIGTPKEELKWLWKETYHHAFPGRENDYLTPEIEEKSFLLLCNHCTNPPCVRVCPTKATFKREDGVVIMDMHRCIGCRFCMAACPFGARSFNWGDPRKAPEALNPGFPWNPDYPTRSMGVVEKCNFCAERLAKGQHPACVEAAAEEVEGALVFGDLADPDSGPRAVLRERYTIRRKPELGTGPNVFYVI
jgi:molybdopterin-containing oxidoreductase family iron-sulfur binding subunit